MHKDKAQFFAIEPPPAFIWTGSTVGVSVLGELGSENFLCSRAGGCSHPHCILVRNWIAGTVCPGCGRSIRAFQEIIIEPGVIWHKQCRMAARQALADASRAVLCGDKSGRKVR